jgi:hypothetical protein
VTERCDLSDRFQDAAARAALGTGSSLELGRLADEALNEGRYSDQLLAVWECMREAWVDSAAAYRDLRNALNLISDPQDAALWLAHRAARKATEGRAAEALCDLMAGFWQWRDLVPDLERDGLDRLFDAYCEMEEPPDLFVRTDHREAFASGVFFLWDRRFGANAVRIAAPVLPPMV